MMRVFRNIPRRVMLSLAVLTGVLVSLALLIPLLGGTRDDAFGLNARLTSELAQLRGGSDQANVDLAYVREHLDQYEALMNSDKLVPHTRRAAVVALQAAATARGFTTLAYSFNAASSTSLLAVASQPQTGGYVVAVEALELNIGAPLDGPVYQFIADVTRSFPGSLIIESFSLQRPSEITDATLALVSQGRDASLVEGEVKFAWRTAQADRSQEAGAPR